MSTEAQSGMLAVHFIEHMIHVKGWQERLAFGFELHKKVGVLGLRAC